MPADSNMGFQQGIMPSTLQNKEMLSFQSVPSFSSMAGSVNMGNCGQIGSSSGLFFNGNPGLVNSSVSQAAPSSSSRQIEPVAGVRPDSELSPEWTIEEQNTLKQGLINAEVKTSESIKGCSPNPQRTLSESKKSFESMKKI